MITTLRCVDMHDYHKGPLVQRAVQPRRETICGEVPTEALVIIQGSVVGPREVFRITWRSDGLVTKQRQE